MCGNGDTTGSAVLGPGLARLFLFMTTPQLIHPASDIASEPFQPIGHRHAPRAPGKLPDAVLEVGEGIIGPTQFGAPEGEAEEHDRLGPTHPAFGLVHAELKLRGQKARKARLDALTGAPAFDQYQQVACTRWASSSCADSPGDWAFYAVSVRRLAPLRSGFLQTAPRGAALAVG
jgi:hypothetical protein